MIEEEPADSTANAEMADDSVRAQNSGAWALPVAGSITSCPKCGPVVIGSGSADDDDDAESDNNEPFSSLRISISFHKMQRPYRVDDLEENQSPCSLLDPLIFPTRDASGSVGGEHLCVVCVRCKFGWVERVAQPGMIYRPREEPE